MFGQINDDDDYINHLFHCVGSWHSDAKARDGYSMTMTFMVNAAHLCVLTCSFSWNE